MEKQQRDTIEASLPKDRRFRMPPEMTDEMRQAAYNAYTTLYSLKGYIAWEDVCRCFRAAFEAKR